MAALSALALVAGLLGGCAAREQDSTREPAEVAADGYVYGYAPIALARTRANMICLLPVNQLYSQAAMSGPETRVVVAPNADTLYSIAWLDLRAGPVLLTHPAMGERYFDFQLLDMYTNVFDTIGTRQTGQAAGSHAIVPPGWRGETPAGAVVIESPTWDAWMIGRTLVESDADLAAARAAQQQYRMTVLESPVPDAPPSLPPTDSGNNPAPQAIAAAGPPFFDELSAILAANPPPAEDAPMLEQLATLGVAPGATPSRGEPEDVAALAAGVVRGDKQIVGLAHTSFGGGAWSSLQDAGRYGTDYLHRAGVAKIGLGANVPEESMYYVARTDAGGAELRGRSADDAPQRAASGYRLHFPAGGLPPIDERGFWSVTMYGPDMFFVANPLGRYAIGDRTPGLVRGDDGSLDLWIGAQPPASGTSNWLPAPPGEFVIMLRSYLPTDQAWTPPVPERLR
ncbi:DUF1254 domain-containing protein [Rhodococcus sp. NPDC058514]|uniref:DUF1254 domain-containing protein n=1 Tax=Rhodococcus sp. NPDC058514 TaxID=3346532 RepID=UPI00365FA457